MRFGIKTVGLFTIDEMIDFAERQEYPAVLLDEKLTVIKKNDAARAELNFLKLGCSAVRYISPESIDEIKSLRPSDTLAIVIDRNGSKCRANVICGTDALLVVCSDISGMYSALCEKHKAFSGYDIEIHHGISEQNTNEHRGLAEIVDNLLSEHTKRTEMSFFNAAEAANRLFDELNRQKSQGRDFRLFVSGNELITEGSCRDFLLIAAALTALCLDNCGGCVSAVLKNEDDELAFEVCCNGVGNMPDEFDFESENGLIGYTAKLLAEANLWDVLRINESGRSGFVLRMPFVKSGEEFSAFDETEEFYAFVASKVLEFGQKGIEK